MSTVPKVCVFGAGAIGGLVAARLSEAGCPVTLVARGATLEAVTSQGGILLEDLQGKRVVPVSAAGYPASPEHQSILFIALKAQALMGALNDLIPLVGPDTVIVPLMNGLPWWYFAASKRANRDDLVGIVDPGGSIGKVLPPNQVVAPVLYMFSRCGAPGIVNHDMGNRILLGHSTDEESDAVDRVADLLSNASFSIKKAPDIRSALWGKLIANAIINPLSVLSESACGPLADSTWVNALMGQLFSEAEAIARALQVEWKLNLEQLIEGFKSIGSFETSMLQDHRKGRSLELDSILGVLCRLADCLGIETPTLSGIYGLVSIKSRTQNEKE